LQTLLKTTLTPLAGDSPTLVIALVIGLFMFFIYRKTFGGVMYSRNFNV